MPRVTIETNLPSLPDGFIEKADTFFKEQMNHPGILFDINTGKTYVYKGERSIVVFVTLLKAGKLSQEQFETLHKNIGEFFVTNLKELPKENFRLHIYECPPYTLSAYGRVIGVPAKS